MNLKRIGLDTSKAVFTLHGVGQDEKAVLRRNMRRAEMETFFAKLPPTHVALEACGGSHHWGRRLAAMRHTVQLIPPQYVKRRGSDPGYTRNVESLGWRGSGHFWCNP